MRGGGVTPITLFHHSLCGQGCLPRLLVATRQLVHPHAGDVSVTVTLDPEVKVVMHGEVDVPASLHMRRQQQQHAAGIVATAIVLGRSSGGRGSNNSRGT